MDKFKLDDEVIIYHTGKFTTEERNRLGWPSHMDHTIGKIGKIGMILPNAEIGGVTLTRYRVYFKSPIIEAWSYSDESLRKATKWRVKKIAKHGAGNKV